jgi:hypothetical protein
VYINYADLTPYVRRVTVLMHSPTAAQNVIETREHAPIWFAALVANRCTAMGRAVNWEHKSGKALYTNSARDAEHIQPFGVSLRRGETLAVWWQPGETAYTLQVYNDLSAVAA